jgi:hypothetical protein
MKKIAIALSAVSALLLSCSYYYNDDYDDDDPYEDKFAFGTFCNNGVTKVIDGEIYETNFELQIGNTVFEASTGTCSNGFGNCTKIPIGNNIPLFSAEYPCTDFCEEIEGEMDIYPGDYIRFTIAVDEYGEPVLYANPDISKYECMESECEEGMYNENTCDIYDPCGWKSDGYCDDACLDYVYEMFDDRDDC